jgi:hypothetical protein
MKLVNETPFALALVPGLGPEGAEGLTVIVKGTFTIVAGGAAPIAEEQLPICYGDEFIDEKAGGSLRFESDLAPFKPRADVILNGSAYAPPGTQASALEVSLQVGRLAKAIRVFGDRRWKCGGRFAAARLGPPAPFAAMPLVYERAYGGIDTVGGGYCERNPIGRGYFKKKRKKSVDGAPAPNLENPQQLIKGWQSRPVPQGFGYYGRGWFPRVKYLGTYDERWQQERSPAPPLDFKPDFHNAAHPDLQVAGYLRGDEEVLLKRLTPDGELGFKLPGIALAGEWERLAGEGTAGDGAARPLAFKLDTLVLLPDEGRLALVWRDWLPVTGRPDAVIARLAIALG